MTQDPGSPPDPPMHDFVDALEKRLRKQAMTERRSIAPKRRLINTGRRTALAAGAAALVTIAVVLAASPTSGTQRAYGKSRILLNPTADARDQPAVHEVAKTIGPTAQLDRVWEAPAFGGTAYLVNGERDWCLTAPDPEADHPDVERGVACTDSSAFDRIGISMVIGRSFIAAIPDGVPAPMLRSPGESSRSIEPTEYGVVALSDLPQGSSVTLYDGFGGSRVHRIDAIDVVRYRCADGGYYVRGRTQPNPCVT